MAAAASGDGPNAANANAGALYFYTGQPITQSSQPLPLQYAVFYRQTTSYPK